MDPAVVTELAPATAPAASARRFALGLMNRSLRVKAAVLSKLGRLEQSLSFRGGVREIGKV